jgi:hypothetical protein
MLERNQIEVVPKLALNRIEAAKADGVSVPHIRSLRNRSSSPSNFPFVSATCGNHQPRRLKAKIKPMNIKVLVIDKVSETFDTKKGSKTLHLLVCQDQSRPPLRNSFDYEMTADELGKYGASLVDKTVELNIRDMTQNFAGRMRMSGAITKVGV